MKNNLIGPIVNTLVLLRNGLIRRYFRKYYHFTRLEFNTISTFLIFVGIILGAYFVTSEIIIPKLFAAGDTSESWDFSNSGDYQVSDSDLVEISGNTARLKVRNYADDVYTSLLLHMDESEGDPSDSSSNTTATASGISYVTGNFNNAADFDGTASGISVAHADSLALSQSNTIEAWTKFEETFNATSHGKKQVVADKGNMKLYYDNQNGKLTYELVPNTASSWTQVAGGSGLNSSWDNNGKMSVTSQTYIGTDIYVGSGNLQGDAMVYKWDGSSWTKIGGNGLNSSWASNTYEEVNSIVALGTNIYAGLGNDTGEAEVWRWNGISWTRIANAVNFGANYDRVQTMAVYDSELYVGLGVSTDEGVVWKCSSCDGTPVWTRVAGSGADAGYTSWGASDDIDAVYALVSDETYLYAGLGASTDDADVWRFNGTTWTQIGGITSGGVTINSGWENADNVEAVLSLALDANYLYAGVGLTADDAKVWRLDWDAGTLDWELIGGPGATGWDASMDIEGVYSLATTGSILYAGLGNSNDDADIWQWNGSSWTQIGGTNGTSSVNSSWVDGVNSREVETLMLVGSNLYVGLYHASDGGEEWLWNGSSWSQIGGNYINGSWGFYGLERVNSMITCGSNLYAGTGYSAGDSTAWKYDGSTWSRIGGQGWGWSSDSLETIYSMACYKNYLYIGFGVTADDGQVWKYSGSGNSWTQVAGKDADGDFTSWGDSDNIEYVLSLTADDTYLYAGLGTSTDDADVWRFDGSVWTQIGGMTSGGVTINSGWGNADNADGVYSLLYDGGYLYAGLGASTDDADIWKLDVDAETLDWTQIAGSGADSGYTSWGSSEDIEAVYSLAALNGNIYAGLGVSTGDAEVWMWSGSTWTKIGGGIDSINSSWEAVTFEAVLSMSSYNGNLYAGLGNTSNTTDGEIWKYNGSVWSKVAGDGEDGSWTTEVEEINSLNVYNGKLYAALGNSANVDASVWSYGGNSVLTSTSVGQNTSWHHIAATYDGATMKLYIDGVLDNSLSTSLQIESISTPLFVGAGKGSDGGSETRGFFDGLIDEVRVSSSARSSFTTKPFATTRQSVSPTTSVMTEDIKNWEEFLVTDAGLGTLTYRISSNGGSVWKFWDGDSWETSSSLEDSNSETDINSHISSFTAGSGGIIWQAVLLGNGDQQVGVSSVEITATLDQDGPTTPENLTVKKDDVSGDLVTGGELNYYNTDTLYFDWDGSTDTGGSGVYGYYVYFGTNSGVDPATGYTDIVIDTNYTTDPVSVSDEYYFVVKARDNAQNFSSGTSEFRYNYDGTAPQSPSSVTVSPGGFTTETTFTFTWPAVGASGGATDSGGSGVSTYQYKTGATTGDYSEWSDPISGNTVTLTDAVYENGTNVFYLRAVDAAGNYDESEKTVEYYYAGTGPGAVTLSVDDNEKDENSFTFTWTLPESYLGDSEDLTYCYMVNRVPSEDNEEYCIWTSTRSAGPDNFATQQTNTFYVVAKNPTDYGGSIDWTTADSVTFTANTTAPGIPNSIEVSDISIKSTSTWRLIVSWASPTDVGSGVSEYEIYQSTDGSTFTTLGTTTGTSYAVTDLIQQDYYFKVRACDDAESCGAFTSNVSMEPTGKYTDAPSLTSEPAASSITTKKATISWTTDRASDSKIQYGTSTGSYGTTEPSNSSQVTSHSISLTNLSPGTTYYYKAKWTDEDGNTGTSSEKSFTTSASPTVKDVTEKAVNLTSATLQFTSNGASKVKIYYGKTTSFGGVKEISTSVVETTYTSTLEDLEDGAKYYYKINLFDSEDSEYEGTILDFETLPRPKISSVRLQEVKGTAQPTMLVSWETNTEVSSIITYYPEGKTSDAKDAVNVAMKKGTHKLVLKGLIPQTNYVLIVKGRDRQGNEAESETQKFTTQTDTRPPLISDLKVEGSVQGAGSEATAQLLVSFNTDEPATSQVEYGEGTGTSYSQRTQEDSTLTYNHLVVISGLTPAKVYHLRVVSKDSTDNKSESVDTVSISPKATDSALDLVVGNLREVFGFLK